MQQEYIDTHAHLGDDAFAQDRAAVIENAFSAGVGVMVEIACSRKDWRPALELARMYPGKIYCACGIHPHDCGDIGAASLAELAGYLQRNEVRALGEIGLDYACGDYPRETQLAALEQLLALTGKIDKPLVLHCRGGGEFNAYADLFAALKRGWRRPAGRKFSGVLHCFSGTLEDAKTALQLGCALGVNGTITYPKNSALREIIKTVGPEHLVIETDCPYLPPQHERGKRNEPSRIPVICAAAALAACAQPDEFAHTVKANSLTLFGL